MRLHWFPVRRIKKQLRFEDSNRSNCWHTSSLEKLLKQKFVLRYELMVKVERMRFLYFRSRINRLQENGHERVMMSCSITFYMHGIPDSVTYVVGISFEALSYISFITVPNLIKCKGLFTIYAFLQTFEHCFSKYILFIFLSSSKSYSKTLIILSLIYFLEHMYPEFLSSSATHAHSPSY